MSLTSFQDEGECRHCIVEGFRGVHPRRAESRYAYDRNNGGSGAKLRLEAGMLPCSSVVDTVARGVEGGHTQRLVA